MRAFMLEPMHQQPQKCPYCGAPIQPQTHDEEIFSVKSDLEELSNDITDDDYDLLMTMGLPLD